MGSWNGTCLISRLPIVYGDRIVILPLHENVWGSPRNMAGSGYCGISSIWQPWLLPLRGVYNDYGSISKPEFCKEQKTNEDILKTIFILLQGRSLRITSRGLSICLGWELGQEDKEENTNITLKQYEKIGNLEGLLDLASQGELNFRYAGNGRTVNFGFCMMHEQMYDRAIKNFIPNCKRVTTDLARHDSQSRNVNFVYFLRRVNLYTKKFKNWPDKLSFFFQTNFSSEGISSVRDNCQDVIVDYYEHMVPVLFEYLAFMEYCDKTRLLLCPGAGAGSQDTNWVDYLAVMGQAMKLCKAKKKEEESW